MDAKLVEHIKVIESMLFFYEYVESIPFNYLNDDSGNFQLLSDIVDYKLKLMLGGKAYTEYCLAIT